MNPGLVMLLLCWSLFCPALAKATESNAALDALLAPADPLQSLPKEQIDQVLESAKPMLAGATQAQRQHLALLEIRRMAILGDYDSALELAHELQAQALPALWRIQLFNLTTQAKLHKGDYLIAFKDLQQAQDLLSSDGSARARYMVYRVALDLFRLAGKVETAQDMAERATEAARELADDRALSLALMDEGVIAKVLGDLDRSLALYSEQLALATNLQDELLIANALTGIAEGLLLQSHYQQALDRANEAANLMQKVGYLDGWIAAEVTQAKALSYLGRGDEAKELSSRILEGAQEAQSWDSVLGASQVLEKIALSDKDYQTAYEALSLGKKAQAKLDDQMNAAALAFEQVRFESQAGKDQVKDLQQDKASALALIEQQQRWAMLNYVLIGLAIMTLAVMLVMLSRAMRQKQRYQALTEVDALSGLYTHGKLYELGREQLANARADHLPFTLVAADIDGFKAINNAFGLGGGDQVLIQAAARLKAVLGEGLYGRVGGEEFLMLFPGRDMEDVAERVRNFVSDEQSASYYGKRIGFSLSFGLSEYNGQMAELSDLAADAYDALYEAKHRGAGMMLVYDPMRARYWAMRREPTFNNII